MRFRSAKEDLDVTTLAAVRGPVAQLGYLAGLRQAGGYAHWGLAKVYGEEAAAQALTEAHRAVTAALLRMPLARIDPELEAMEDLLDRPVEQLLAPGTDALARAHFSLVWGVLASVARRRKPRLPAA
jgi:hypothetical protein